MGPNADGGNVTGNVKQVFKWGGLSRKQSGRSCTETYPKAVGHHVTTFEGTV